MVPGRRSWLAGAAAALGALAAPAQAQPDPALAPPPPVELSPFPAPAAPAAPLPSAPPLAGVESLPGGGWRLTFEAGGDTPSAPQGLALPQLGAFLARETTGRVTLWAEAFGEEDVSATRRLALRRGLAVRSGLVAGGLPETRVDIRPLGHVGPGRDLVDVLPLGATRG